MIPPLKPKQIIGKYRVVRLIAMGGMGAVYEVLHTGLDRRDALKVMLPEFASRPELRARFIREAKVTNRVRHPGIVQIYEISELADGSPYFVMEYLDGETLAQRMDSIARRTGGRKSLADLAPLRQVASILASCHAKGLIHRDLKPGNILLIKDPEVPGGERAKLLDFGIVKIQAEPVLTPKSTTEPQTQAGLLLGTPEYMAPEQWGTGQPITEKVDVYALGVMAYRILSGRLPFLADSPLAFGVQHVSEPPPPLRGFGPDLPLEICTLVDGMLAKSARQRPGIGEVISILDRISGQSGSPERASGQLVIPDSFSSGSLPAQAAISPSASKPPPPAPGESAKQPSARPVAKGSQPQVSASFVPSGRPALPEATTARGSEPPHRTISLDFASLLPEPKDHSARPAAPVDPQSSTSDNRPSSAAQDGNRIRVPLAPPAFHEATNQGLAPASERVPRVPSPSALRSWLWLGLVGLLSLIGVLLVFNFKPSLPVTPPDAQTSVNPSSDSAITVTQFNAEFLDMTLPPESIADASEIQPPVDFAKSRDATDGSVPKVPPADPNGAKQQGKTGSSRGEPRKVGVSCILNKDIPDEQQKLLIEGFKQSGVLLSPGDRVVIVNRDGRPHLQQLPTFLLVNRELIEYALRGLFPNGFPKLVVIQCPAAG